jgi:hypothetical protein
MQSFFGKEKKKTVVRVLSAWRVVQGRMGAVDYTLNEHLSMWTCQALGHPSYPIPAKEGRIRCKVR